MTRQLMPILLAIASLSAYPVSAAVLNVPSQYPNIQAAINTAKAGDHVVLADGTYTGLGNINLDFLGKTITLESQNGAAKTIIDCHVDPDSSEPNNRAIYIHNGEKQATIKGIMVTGENEGDHASGDAGIFIEKGNVIIADCIFKDNNGSGLRVELGGSASVSNCIFIGNGNTPTYSKPAASLNGDAYFLKCMFAANHGRGMAIEWGKIIVTNCIFRDNECGGLNISHVSPLIKNCSFANNVCKKSYSINSDIIGGGLYVGGNGANPSIVNCLFSGNTAVQGGGLFADGGSVPHIKNCLFMYNTAQDSSGSGRATSGGAILVGWGSSPVFTNCTITGNTAPTGFGGAVSDDRGINPIFVNCILYGDKGGEFHVGTYLTNNPMVTFCDVEGTFAGNGNIDSDPLFVNEATGDFGLQHGSPCLGTGTHVGAALTDFKGKPRPIHPSMGVFEEGPAFK